jgi:dihydropteroate synthase
MPAWLCRGRPVNGGGRPLVMGIVNVTPDSFSDGGRHFSFSDAVEFGLRLVGEGADILDIGGESTRPGAAPVPAAEEARRVVPVVRELARQVQIPVSVDTRKAAVAEEALSAGACIVNDVSALTHDPEMGAVARRHNAGVILMHMRGTPETMQDKPEYGDVVGEVTACLRERLDALEMEGIRRETMCVDPGIGFGKTVEHNLKLLANIGTLRLLGRPVLIGLSRKSFLGSLTQRAVGDRLAGSIAAAAWCLARGADILRVHDVGETRDAVAVVSALTARVRGGEDQSGNEA